MRADYLLPAVSLHDKLAVEDHVHRLLPGRILIRPAAGEVVGEPDPETLGRPRLVPLQAQRGHAVMGRGDVGRCAGVPGDPHVSPPGWSRCGTFRPGR